MHNMTRIQRVSRRFRFFFVGLIFCIPLGDALYWLFFNQLSEALFALPVEVHQELSFLSRVLAFLVSLIPVSVATFGVYTLVSLFRLYENAIVFTAKNVNHFRTLGHVMICWVMAKMIYIPLISVVISFNNPPGQRMLVAQFELPDMAALVIGAVVVLMSWVMDEGRKLEDEQAHTV